MCPPLEGERLQLGMLSLARGLPAFPSGSQEGAACLRLHPDYIFVDGHYSQRKGPALALSLEKLLFHQTETLIPG